MSDSGEGATKYFDSALATSDYYGTDPGLWGGKGAEMLGMVGPAARDDFIAVASNKWPDAARVEGAQRAYLRGCTEEQFRQQNARQAQERTMER